MAVLGSKVQSFWCERDVGKFTPFDGVEFYVSKSFSGYLVMNRSSLWQFGFTLLFCAALLMESSANLRAVSAGSGNLRTEEASAAAPSISNVSDNRAAYANEQIPTYEKFEITFDVATQAVNLQHPYDPSPPPGLPVGEGITVNALFTPDNWQTVYTQPAFYYQIFLDEMRDGRQWLYPTGEFRWKARFAPNRAGSWHYKLLATDAGGTSETAPMVIDVIDSGKPGFIRVSSSDPRYFEYDNGTYFPGLGYNTWFDADNPVLENESTFPTLNANGLQLFRIWLTAWSIFGSQWNPYYGGRNDYGGYIPRTGLMAFDDDVENESTIKMRIDYETTGNDGWFDACRFRPFYEETTAVKPNTDYRFRVRYRGFNISGPRKGSFPDYGFVAEMQSSPDCYEPENGIAITNYGGNTPTEWRSIEGIWNSQERNYLPRFYLALDNVNEGIVYVDSVEVQEVLGSNEYGPNILNKHSMEHHLYFSQLDSYQFDKMLAGAEGYDIYLKLVVLEKGEDIFRKIGYDGNFVDDQDEFFYGDGRRVTKGRWLQQAWWRYLQARWGYSTAIHSWELLNEGDPASVQHYQMADEFGKFMHCRVFDVPVAATDSAQCTFDHPNAHLVTTSNWHSYPKDAFWANGQYPNVDYGDIHLYIYPDHEEYEDAAQATVGLSTSPLVQNTGKPVMRGESGFVDLNTTLAGKPEAMRVWLHNFIWGGINAGSMIESYWYDEHIVNNSFDHRSEYKHYYDFIQDVPLSNGHYEDAAATTSDARLRVWGQKDLVNEQAHLWLQNADHTWRTVADGKAISPVSASVTVVGFQPNMNYLVSWWATDAGQVSHSEMVRADGEGHVILTVSSLTSDTAVKIATQNTSQPTATPTLNPTVTPRPTTTPPPGTIPTRTSTPTLPPNGDATATPSPQPCAATQTRGTPTTITILPASSTVHLFLPSIQTAHAPCSS